MSTPSDLDCVLRVATKAISQDDTTPESERLCTRRLLEMAIPLLEQARLDADLNAIRHAPDRDTAKRVRERVMHEAAAKRRTAADAEAAGHMLFAVWGPKQVGDYPSGACRTGD
jgi:hypothetical protein